MEAESKPSKRPKESKFKQQKLPAWQPILTAQTVLPVFAAIGISFIPIGVALLITSNNVKEIKIEYTNCVEIGTGKKCHEVITLNKTDEVENPVCKCKVDFEIKPGDEMTGEVYFYYGLSNFYQNHRRYVKSRSNDQLYGDKSSTDSYCDPYKEENNKRFAPCGAIARSFFQDGFKLFKGDSLVSFNKTGIAWRTDKEVKFKNPDPTNNLTEAFKDTIKPKTWLTSVDKLDTDPSNNGYKNEDLIVWMRTAALPNFRKLHRKIDLSRSPFSNSQMNSGKYTVEIDYSFDVSAFKGKKYIIITTTSWLGGKNPFLGVAYIVTGCVCLVLAIIFLIVHLKIGKKPHDMVTTLNNNTEY